MKKSILTTIALAIFLVLFGGVHFAHADITTGLQGWWKLDDGSGASAVDSSGNGYTMTLAGAPLPTWTTSSKIGPYALNFNSNNSQSTYNNDFNKTDNVSSFSVAYWIYNTGTSYGTPVGQASSGVAGWFFYNTFPSNQLVSFYVYTVNGVAVSTYDYGSLALNAWHHVVGVYDGANVRLYVDGSDVGTDPALTGNTTKPYADYGYALRFGRIQNELLLDGRLDEVRIYDRALSADDVQRLYAYRSDTLYQYFLTNTAASTWTVPSDWNNSNNTIEVIGGGAGGVSVECSSYCSGAGGGGGAYAEKTNLSLTPNSSVNISIGIGGSANNSGADTWFNGTNVSNSSVGAKGGTISTGGSAASSVGDTKYSGGNGGTSLNTYAGGGGGGAGGSYGTGGNGAPELSGRLGGNGGGGGGGGTDGNSGNADTLSGGNGGNNHLGSGSGAGGVYNSSNASPGTNGGGGGGGPNGYSGGSFTYLSAGDGGSGTEWDATHGSGGGGGGAGAINTYAGKGGGYGGGGGGGSYYNVGPGYKAAGGAGAKGIIVITYTLAPPTVAPTVTTQTASSVYDTSATLNGNITDTGGANPTVRGFAYGTASDLSTAIATTTESGSFGTGAFTNFIFGLSCNTTYYSRAYSKNSAGTGFGTTTSFTTSSCSSSPPVIKLLNGMIRFLNGRIKIL